MIQVSCKSIACNFNLSDLEKNYPTYNLQILQMLAQKLHVYLAISRHIILRGFEKVEHCSSDMMHQHCCNNCKTHLNLAIQS